MFHGLEYAFPARRGDATGGMATVDTASPLKTQTAEDETTPSVQRYGLPIRAVYCDGCKWQTAERAPCSM